MPQGVTATIPLQVLTPPRMLEELPGRTGKLAAASTDHLARQRNRSIAELAVGVQHDRLTLAPGDELDLGVEAVVGLGTPAWGHLHQGCGPAVIR